MSSATSSPNFPANPPRNPDNETKGARDTLKNDGVFAAFYLRTTYWISSEWTPMAPVGAVLTEMPVGFNTPPSVEVHVFDFPVS